MRSPRPLNARVRRTRHFETEMEQSRDRAILGVRHKSQLPRGWSYPVGAEALTEVLRDVPHSVSRPLWFSHSEPFRLKDRRKRESEDLPLRVLSADFSTWGVGAQPPPKRPLWTLYVGSVPSHLRHWVRACLIREALPRLRRWLLQPFAETALDATPQCSVLLYTDRKHLVWEQRTSKFVDATVEDFPCDDAAPGV